MFGFVKKIVNRLRIENSELLEEYERGLTPLPSEMLPTGKSCEWQVTMLTGPLPNFGDIFNHRKRFIPPVEQLHGCNIFFSSCFWGWFNARATYRDRSMLINYNVPENRFPFKRIRDKLRTTSDPNKMIGAFNLYLFGREWFLGYFYLTRKQ